MDGEEFQSNKCLFGDPDSPSGREYALRIPELASEASSSSPRYHRRELRISWYDAPRTFGFEFHC